MGNILKKYNLTKAQWEVVGGAITGDTLPIGSIIPFGGTEAPTGWLICDGSMLNRTTYKELFAAIGTNFGTDGPGNFYIPDLRGKVVVGQDTTDSNFGMGAIGGEKAHTLTVEEMPSHSHTTNTVFPFKAGGLTTCTPNSDATSSTGIAADVVNNTGGNQPHNNLQPYQVTNYIIKAFQSAGVVAQVSNTKSNSTTDTYSCDYVNKQLLNIDKGSVTIETSNNNYIEVAVTFNKTFNTIPTVMLTPDSVGPGFNSPNVGVKRNSITTTGFTMVYSSNYTAGLTNKVSYLAIE